MSQVIERQRVVDDVLDNREAAAFMRYSVKSLSRFRQAGLLPFIRPKRKVLYRRRDLMRFLEQHRVEVPDDILTER